MSQASESVASSDQGLIELLRQRGELGITELARAMNVTATAVRQRLNRLMAEGLVQRNTTKPPRGRPSHAYTLTSKGIDQTGNNFTDLTIALWQEIREIRNEEIRQGLLQRLAKRMAGLYSPQIQGNTTAERMQSLTELFRQRDLPFQLEPVSTDPAPDAATSLPILTAWACPYPKLAEQDRGVCALENMLISELVGERVKLSDCRLDGGNCCQFQVG
jgi:DeoR family transcriptional regulator, suf operon transcriptional repressor